MAAAEATPRRATLALAAPAVIGAALAPPVSAEEPVAVADLGAIFVGRYTDPNHPGGYREISLLDTYAKEGVRNAKVEGGQGRGEPDFFELPAVVSKGKDRKGNLVDTITINFRPKGGPPNFTGVWDKDGITFVRDRNHWPKQTK